VEASEILQFNPDLDPELLQVGQVLLIPPDLESLGATRYGDPDDPQATRADFVVHVVRSGDALLSIAEKYGVTVQDIRRANDLAPYDDTLSINQSLIIPLAEPSPTPTPTPDEAATPTPRPPYAAPSLLNPVDGQRLEGAAPPVVLQWASVGILEDREWYLVRLSRVGSTSFLEWHTTRTTSWRVPIEVLSTAGSGAMEFRWTVQVVEARPGQTGLDAFVEAGAASEERVFGWQGPAETPVPTSGGSN
jgi:LysM repeat protein